MKFILDDAQKISKHLLKRRAGLEGVVIDADSRLTLSQSLAVVSNLLVPLAMGFQDSKKDELMMLSRVVDGWNQGLARLKENPAGAVLIELKDVNRVARVIAETAPVTEEGESKRMIALRGLRELMRSAIRYNLDHEIGAEKKEEKPGFMVEGVMGKCLGAVGDFLRKFVKSKAEPYTPAPNFDIKYFLRAMDGFGKDAADALKDTSLPKGISKELASIMIGVSILENAIYGRYQSYRAGSPRDFEDAVTLVQDSILRYTKLQDITEESRVTLTPANKTSLGLIDKNNVEIFMMLTTPRHESLDIMLPDIGMARTFVGSTRQSGHALGGRH